MGKIYKTDGMVIATEPANGNDFQLSELRNVVGGLMMVVNEEGKLQNLPVNYNATTVLQNMAVIYGRPSWSSKFLIATVNSCGRFEPLQFKFTDKGALGMVDYTDYVYNPSKRCKEAINKQFDGRKIHDIECVAFTTKKGSENVLESAPVSVRLAIQEGWYTKNGSKWQTMTRQMLMYRAASMWTNAYAPELSMGMRTVEEQQDILDANVEAGLLPAKLRARTMKSHCSFDTCKEILLANDLSQVHNIVLIHLSDGNANAKEFKDSIQEATQKTVSVATPGMKINFNKSPF